MRPQVGGDAQPLRPRKRSSADLGPSSGAGSSNTSSGASATTTTAATAATATTASVASPASFMLGTQRDVEAYLDGRDESSGDIATSSSSSSATLGSPAIDDSTYGVRSISDSALADSIAMEGVDAAEDRMTAGNEEIARLMARRRSTIRPTQQPQHRRGSTSGLSSISGYTNDSTSPGKSREKETGREMVDIPISQPMTPLSHASPVMCSDAPPSPRSILLHSDDDLETGSQAILSSDEEDEHGDAQDEASENSSTGLQLVMPSLMMPSRRPFTDRGKRLGKLKVLLTGAAGAGKSSLIKSIVRICEDVVHIDPQSVSSSQVASRPSSKKPTSSNPTTQITEIAGSTKPYPGWWAQVEESQVLRRRRSGGEEVLERNLCFIDTPGYEKSLAKMSEQMESILQYLQTQMARAIAPASMHDSELLGYLGGAGGSQVDAVLFLFDSQPTALEIELYGQLSRLAYVIPVLAKSDLIAESDYDERRASLLRSLEVRPARPSGLPTDWISELYSVCSSTSNDLETMDASLLMTSGYVEPLHPSQLPDLVNHLFHPENAAFLKHVAAKKLVAWRRSSPSTMALSPSPLRTNLFAPTLPRSTGHSSPGAHPAAPLSPTSAALTYTSSRLLDYKQREERMAQVHLGQWADSLRRNLAAERLRFEALANAERERWLQARMAECVFDGQIMDTANAWPAKGSDGRRPPRNRSSGYQRMRQDADDLDPLALMRWRRHLLNALQVVGGVSIMSAVAIWFARTLELDWEWLDEYGLGRLDSVLNIRGGAGGGAGAGLVGR